MYLPKTVQLTLTFICNWKRLFVLSRRNALMSSHYGATYMKHHTGRVAESLARVSYFGRQPLGVYLNEDNQIVPFNGCHTSKRKPEREARRTRKMSGDATHPMTIRGSPTKYVKLNVGGSLHYTTIGTLSKQDSMLRAMFSGRMEVLTDSEGMIWYISLWVYFSLIDHWKCNFRYVFMCLKSDDKVMPTKLGWFCRHIWSD